MIERLQRALDHVEEMSPEAQEDLAQQIEEMAEPLSDLPESQGAPAEDTLPKRVRDALALAGTWSDLQDDGDFTRVPDLAVMHLLRSALTS